MEKLSRTTPGIKELLAITFPEYKGRTIKLQVRAKHYMQDFWSGGTRYFTKVVCKNTGEVSRSKFADSHPGFVAGCHAEFPIPADMLIVEHIIFCGKDLGIRITTSTLNWLEGE